MRCSPSPCQHRGTKGAIAALGKDAGHVRYRQLTKGEPLIDADNSRAIHATPSASSYGPGNDVLVGRTQLLQQRLLAADLLVQGRNPVQPCCNRVGGLNVCRAL